DFIGLGAEPDPVDAKLDQVLDQLNVIQAEVTDLQTDVQTLTSTILNLTDKIELQPVLRDIEDATNKIQACAQQVTLVAKTSGLDSTDDQMRSFAKQMVGREAGPCDLSNQFSIIHSRIVPDPLLGAAASPFYTLLARFARTNKTPIEFERVASHFI